MRGLLITTVIMLGALMKVDGKEEGSYLRDITQDYKTQHLDWAPKLSGGSIKTLFIVNRVAGREVAELRERLDVEQTALTTFNTRVMAVEDMYESAVEGTTVYEKTNELLRKLEGNYDLIVLGNFALDALPAEAQFKILSKVSQGAGLLLVYQKPAKLSKIFSSPIPGTEAVLSLAAAKDLPGTTQLKTFSFGKGRIATLDYGKNSNDYSLTAPTPYSNTWAASYENSIALVMRAMLWTAGRDAAIKISCPGLANNPELEGKPQTFNIEVDGSKGDCLRARLRNAANEILKEKTFTLDASGPTQLAFEVGALAAGKYYLDVLGGKQDSPGLLASLWGATAPQAQIDNFGYFYFSVISPVGKISVDTKGQEAFKPGEKIAATFEMEKPLAEKGNLEITLADSPYGRVWQRQNIEVQPGEREIAFSLDNYHVPTIAGRLQCRLYSKNAELAECGTTLFFPKRQRDMYTMLAWNCIPDALAPFYAKQVVDRLGWNHGLSHPSAEGGNARNAALFNQHFIPYMVRVGLAMDEKTKGMKQYSWFFLTPEDQKRADSIADQSFYNPEIRSLWSKGIASRIKNLPKYDPSFYSLGDENYFNYDNKFSDSDDKAFKSFLQSRYHKIETLNAAWGTNYKSFAEIKMSLKEAKEGKIFPAWFDVRQFWERQYADIHHFLAEEIKKHDPEALVGAEGSVPGDLEYTLDGLEFWGPYSDMVMDEVLRCLGRDKIRMLWWGGYVGSHGGRDIYPIPLWRPLLEGTVNGSAWFSSTVAADMVSTDMRFANFFKAMLPFLDDLKNGMAQLLINTPLADDGVAVLWSHPSASATLLDPRFVNPKDSMGTFINFCHANGINFDFLSGSMLAGKLARYKVLFLFGASALSGEEAAQIKAFAENGGMVVADINPGLLDAFLKPAGKNMLEPLFGNITYAASKPPELARIDIDKTLGGQRVKFAAEKGLSTPDLPPMQIREVGKGKAILLNFSFASARNTACDGTSMQKFLLELLAAAKVAPYVKLDGINTDNIVLRTRAGNGFQLIGLLCDKKDIGKTARFTVPRDAYIYETGKKLVAHSSTWTFDLDVPFKLFTLYDKEPVAPEFSLEAREAFPGQKLKADIAAIPRDTVLFVQIKGPDGVVLPLCDQIIVVDGKTQAFDLVFAYGDKPGEYTVCVKSVNTGLETQQELTLRAKP